MNHLAELKAILDIVARQKQKVHMELNFDGTRFYWGTHLGSISASQLDALLNADAPVDTDAAKTFNSALQSGGKEHHGT